MFMLVQYHHFFVVRGVCSTSLLVVWSTEHLELFCVCGFSVCVWASLHSNRLKRRVLGNIGYRLQMATNFISQLPVFFLHRYLVMKGRGHEALLVLQKINHSSDEYSSMDTILELVDLKASSSISLTNDSNCGGRYKDLFLRKYLIRFVAIHTL